MGRCERGRDSEGGGVKWRLIKTAKLGQKAILWNGDDMYFGELMGGKKPHWGVWGIDDQKYGLEYEKYFNPTHWMPLPEETP